MSYNLTSDEIKVWRQRIRASEEWRKPQQDKWERHLGYLKNKFFKYEAAEDQICVNLVHPFVRVVIPATYAKNPDIEVKPRRTEFTALAENVEEVLRYFFGELKIKEELKLVLFDSIMFGHGWLKMGYQTDFDQAQVDEKLPLIQQMMQSLMKMAVGNSVTPEEEYAMARSASILEEAPWACRVSIWDMFVPAFSKRNNSLPWIAERIIVPTIDVKNNPEYENTKDLKPSTDIEKLLQAHDARSKNVKFTIADEDLQYNVLYEIHDVRRNRVCTIADDYDKQLAHKDQGYSFLANRYPYQMLGFNFVSDEFYPMSDIEPWEPQQLELNKTRSQMIRHRKRFNRKYVTKEGAFSEEEMAKLKSGEDGAIVQTTDDSVEAAIQPLKDAPLPAETYAVELRIKADIDEIGGVSGYQKGTVASGAKTATEASIVESNSRARADERLDVMTTYVQSVARDLALICLKYLSQDEVAKIVGEEEAQNWITLDDNEELERELMFNIDVGSTAPVNREVERQQSMELYAMVKDDPVFDLLQPRIDLLKKFRIKDYKRWINEKMLPLVMQKRMAEVLTPPEQPINPEGGEGTEPATPLDQAVGDGTPTMGNIKSGLTRRLGVNTGTNGKQTPGYE